jgi:hypothetical protein
MGEPQGLRPRWKKSPTGFPAAVVLLRSSFAGSRLQRIPGKYASCRSTPRRRSRSAFRRRPPRRHPSRERVARAYLVCGQLQCASFAVQEAACRGTSSQPRQSLHCWIQSEPSNDHRSEALTGRLRWDRESCRPGAHAPASSCAPAGGQRSKTCAQCLHPQTQWATRCGHTSAACEPVWAQQAAESSHRTLVPAWPSQRPNPPEIQVLPRMCWRRPQSHACMSRRRSGHPTASACASLGNSLGSPCRVPGQRGRGPGRAPGGEGRLWAGGRLRVMAAACGVGGKLGRYWGGRGGERAM